MKNETRHLVTLGLLMFLVIKVCPGQETTSQIVRQGPTIFFNQKIIDGLNSDLDVNDPVILFKAVFAALDTNVIVYPTENYYYFQVYISGKTIWGNLRLDAGDRDQGIIHIGYFNFDDNGMRQDRSGNNKMLSSGDGVMISRTKDLVYTVTYLGKKVTFYLNDIRKEAPFKSRLSGNEVFVGPIFDESGLKFFLIYNRKENHFFYILNEEGKVAEEFSEIGDDVLMGVRTSFIFYSDSVYNRKILLAVNGRSTDRNNYYDGPFDQLPDNSVETSDISRYIQLAYPYTKGRIDKFGGFKDQEGARVVIFPYSVYYKEEEITNLVNTAKNSGLSRDEFYTRITPDPYASLGKE